MISRFLDKGVYTLVILICLACTVTNTIESNAQDRAQKVYKQGEEALDLKNYEAAEKAFLKSIALQPDFDKPRIKLGGLAFLQKNWEKSKKYFQEVLSLTPEKNEILWFKLGEIGWNQEDYEFAISNLETFLDTGKGAPRIIRRAEKYLRDALFLENDAQTLELDIKALPKTINTPLPEYLPALPAKEDIMVFTRRVDGQEDFYVSKYEHGSWQEGQPMAHLNTIGNEGAHCLSADGKLLIFTACERRDSRGSCDLYFSVKKDNGWTAPRNLGQEINSKAWDSQPSLSADGRYLYFSSERSGGKGGRDVWIAQRTKTGWGKIKNLEQINTSENEEAPFIHPDN